MKKFALLIFLVSIQIIAQKVTVVEDAAVTNLKDGKYFYPVVSNDGSTLLITTESYKGLWSKNLTNGQLGKISDATNAGYEPSFGISSSEILFKEDKFVNGKRFSSLLSFDLTTKRTSKLEENIRDLKLCRDYNSTLTKYVRDSEIKSTMKQTMMQKTSASDKIVFIQDSKIVLTDGNSKKVISPLGDGNYIWPSLSPDKTKLLFTLAGKGTYVSDLNGKILQKIGYANYPSWSQDGNWILFMKDIDNGEVVTSSDVYIANLKTGKYFNLTLQKDDIPMFPKWGSTNTEIFYNTNSGQIRKIKLKYE